MRSPVTVLLLISCFFAKFARSQSNELIIQGQTGKLYLEHTVVPKENWYSVGRLYNVSPKELAPYNHVTLGQPLVIGQVINIPLTAVNFSQNGIKAPGESLIPVYHITQEKEWMYRISVNHNKVPIPSIEKWNNITPDQIHPGLHLIVGYLKVKTALSALATAPKPTVAVNAPATTPAPAIAKADSPKSMTPASHPVQTVIQTTTTQPTVTQTTVTQPATTQPATTQPTVTQPAPATETAINTPHFNGGTFRSDYSDGGKSSTGQAGVFKSTSGWQDGKYYALMNNAMVGTIVRVTDQTSGKSVYAKVLGQLPEMKESAGLSIRISNAAAAELGEGEGRFNVQINY
jgi:hypothetical protein